MDTQGGPKTEAIFIARIFKTYNSICIIFVN